MILDFVVHESPHSFLVLACWSSYAHHYLYYVVLNNCSLLSCCLAGSQFQQPNVNRISFEGKVSAKATLRVRTFHIVVYFGLTTCRLLRDCELITKSAFCKLTIHSIVCTVPKLLHSETCVHLKAICHCLNVVI